MENNPTYLRIKKDVNLEKLEEFGYKHDETLCEWTKSLIPEGYLLFVVIHEDGTIMIVSDLGDDCWCAESGDIGIGDIEKAGLTEAY